MPLTSGQYIQIAKAHINGASMRSLSMTFGLSDSEVNKALFLIFIHRDTPGVDHIVRALSSSETGRESTAHPLDEICKTIALALPDAKYMPGLIKKKRACRELKLLSLEDKRKEIEGLYYLDEAKVEDGMIERPHFLIVDDVLTSGTTVSEIARVLKARFGCQVSVFTLAKTARPEYSDIRDNSHFTEFNPYLRSQFPGMEGAPSASHDDAF